MLAETTWNNKAKPKAQSSQSFITLTEAEKMRRGYQLLLRTGDTACTVVAPNVIDFYICTVVHVVVDKTRRSKGKTDI